MVQAALRKIIGYLADVPAGRISDRGLVLCASDARLVALVPEIPIRFSDYRCDKTFALDNIIPYMSASTYEPVLAVLIKGQTLEMTLVKGTEHRRLLTKTRMKKKHKKGGQSAPRFQRTFINQDHQWSKAAAEQIIEQAIEHECSVCVVSGPFANEVFSAIPTDRLQCHVTVETTLMKTATYHSTEARKCTVVNEIVFEFQRLMRIDASHVAYGPDHVNKAVSMNMARVIVADETGRSLVNCDTLLYPDLTTYAHVIAILHYPIDLDVID